MATESRQHRRDRRLGSDLVASDRRYFEAGARRYLAGAARIAHLPGFEMLASGCVVHGVRPDRITGDAGAWVSEVEDRIRGLGCGFGRWYLDESEATAPLAAVLRQSGYRSRVELGFVRDAAPLANSEHDPRRLTDGAPAMALRAVDSPRRWEAKLAIHRQSTHGVDGYAVAPDAWMAMEQRKCDAGYMRPYLIEIEGQPGGTVNVAPFGRMLRMKNLVVAPAYRRQGVATRVAVALAGMAGALGYEAVGCFAIVGEIGARIYPVAGYRIVIRQVEWLKTFARHPRSSR